MSERKCLIVGAGIAGLLAAERLQSHGWQATVVEQALEPGGRLRTHRVRLPDGRLAVFDSGAQFFTVRSEHFQELVDEWLQGGIVAEWSRGFAASDGSYFKDGYSRYRGVTGMVGLARHLAQAIDIRFGARVRAVRYEQDRWILDIGQKTALSAPFLILTAPAPQALQLLRGGGVSLPTEVNDVLSSLTYDPCLALLVALAGPSAIPEPGGMWPASEDVSWIADNRQKRISTVPTITIHGSPAFSQAYFEADDDTVQERLLDATGDYLGADILSMQLERWRYSIPRLVHPLPTLSVPGLPALVLAGDAFAGPRVEGAALSGIAAAEALLQKLA